MNKPGKGVGRVIGAVVLIVLFSAALIFALYKIQSDIALKNTISALKSELEQVTANYEKFSYVKESNTKHIDEIYQSYAKAIAAMLRRRKAAIDRSLLTSLSSQYNLRNIVIIDRSGAQKAAAAYCPADFRLDRYNRLKAISPANPASESFSVTLDGVKSYYYGAAIDDEYIAVIIADAYDIEDAQEEMLGLKNILSNAKPGINGFCMAVNSPTYAILWAPDKNLIGDSVLDYIVQHNEKTNHYTAAINGVEYYMAQAAHPNFYYGDITFCSLIPKAEADRTAAGIPLSVTITFIMVAVVIAVSCDPRGEDGKKSFRSVFRHVFPISAISILLLGFMAFYVQTLFAVSASLQKCETGISNTTELLYSYQMDLERINRRYDEYLLEKAETAAFFLERFPDMASTGGLKEIAEILDCEEVRIFDTDGKTVASSRGKDAFALPENPGEPGYDFWLLLRGLDELCQSPLPLANNEYRQYAGHPLRSADGDVVGFVQVSYIPVQYEVTAKNYSFESALSNYTSGTDGFIFAIDKNTGAFSWHPNERMIGKNATVYGLKENEMKDGFTGFISLNGTDYFTSCAEFDGRLVYAADSDNSMYSYRFGLCLWYTLAIAVTVLLYSFTMCLLSCSGGELLRDNIGKKEFQVFFRNAANLQELPRSKQLSAISRSLMTLFAVLIFSVYLFDSFTSGSNSIIHYVFSGNWEHGFNIFSVTAIITLICSVYVVSSLINRLLGFLAAELNPRGETLCRLASNFVRYLSFFVTAFYGLSFLGVDTPTLLASAGIMSIVIGLGANKLIADILAGLAIVFDGTFQVGDWIETGNYKGFVREIGIRTTKLQDRKNQYHIINNSKIEGIINSSVDNFLIVIKLWVRNDCPYAKVEKLIDDAAPEIRAEFPDIIGGPWPGGMMDVTGNAYEIAVAARCHGSKRLTMEVEIRKAIIRILVENDCCTTTWNISTSTKDENEIRNT